jgi:hypothetical protein
VGLGLCVLVDLFIVGIEKTFLRDIGHSIFGCGLQDGSHDILGVEFWGEQV